MAAGQLTPDDCGHALIDLELHPITEQWYEAEVEQGNYPSPAQQLAMDNVVKSGITQSYPMFVTDEGGGYEDSYLIGKRIVSGIVEGQPIMVGMDMILNPSTGGITSIYPNQRVWLVIGYEIDGLPNLIP